jgi:hypothetical protein
LQLHIMLFLLFLTTNMDREPVGLDFSSRKNIRLRMSDNNRLKGELQ